LNFYKLKQKNFQMSTNLQSKRTSLPEPDQVHDAKAKPVEIDNVNDETQPLSEMAAKEDPVQVVEAQENMVVEEAAKIEPTTEMVVEEAAKIEPAAEVQAEQFEAVMEPAAEA